MSRRPSHDLPPPLSLLNLSGLERGSDLHGSRTMRMYSVRFLTDSRTAGLWITPVSRADRAGADEAKLGCNSAARMRRVCSRLKPQQKARTWRSELLLRAKRQSLRLDFVADMLQQFDRCWLSP